MDECCEVQFEGQIDIGSSNGPRMKMMSPVCDENEWTAYVSVVMKSEIHGIAVDEQHVECGVMLTQLLQETQADTDVEETPLVVSNKTMLNVEPVCQSVGVCDATADTRFILGVDHQSIATRFALDIDPSFVESEFMSKYEPTFGDERAEDSANDRPVPELCKRNKAMLQQALTEHAPEMPNCWNLSQVHQTVADGLRFDDSVPLINYDNIIIWRGIIFKTMEAMKIYLVEYAVFHHHPFMVKHSDENKHYVVTCHRGCPWTVHARVAFLVTLQVKDQGSDQRGGGR
jgi:hypothetical protein